MVQDHGDHGESTEAVGETVQRIVTDHHVVRLLQMQLARLLMKRRSKHVLWNERKVTVVREVPTSILIWNVGGIFGSICAVRLRTTSAAPSLKLVLLLHSIVLSLFLLVPPLFSPKSQDAADPRTR